MRRSRPPRRGVRAPTTRRPSRSPPKWPKKKKVTRAERDAVHRRILESLSRRDAKKKTDARPLEPEPEPEPEPVRSQIKNRMGDDDPWNALMADLLSNDFGPLADECFAAAKERNPELGGMADIRFTVVADEDVGGVVETAEAGDGNEIEDPGFVECMQETMLSTIFPPPTDNGRRDIKLTMPF